MAAPDDDDDAIPETAVHPRVLPLSCEGGYAQLFVVWRDPGGARALHGARRPLVEASLLMDLCRVGETRRSGALSGLSVVVFEPVAGSDEALAAFEGTVMAVTHDRWFARGFDRFVVFGGDGRVVEYPEPVWDEGRVSRAR